MLKPLRIATPLAPPTLASDAAAPVLLSTEALPVTPVAPNVEPESPLGKVCTIEGIAVPGKSKQQREPSLYTIELHFCPPCRTNLMLTPTWRIGTDLGDRKPDARVAKTYKQVFQFKDQLKVLVATCGFAPERCRLCHALRSLFHGEDTTPHGLSRAFLRTHRKCTAIEQLLTRIIYRIVRAQRPARPTAPLQPNCVRLAEITALVAAFLEL
jgi:hypothetical protein